MEKDLKDNGISTLQHYLNQIGLRPALNFEQEKELAIRVQKGDVEAKKELVEKNLRLVVNIVRKYRHHLGEDFLDLIEEGNVGLIKAAEKFDPTLGFRFSTYAVWWIKQAIDNVIHNRNIVKIPERLSLVLRKYSKQVEQFKTEKGRLPLVSEMVKITGKTREEIEKLNRYLNVETLSLDVTLQEDSKDSFLDTLVDDNIQDPVQNIHLDYLMGVVDQWLSTLSAEQSEVIARHFGLKNFQKSSLLEISKSMHLPLVKIRKIQQTGLIALRKLAINNDMVDLAD